MSDYGSLYLIETNYNSERDAIEVIFGYLEQDEIILGRISSVRVIVNIPGCRENEAEAIERGLEKARKLLVSASKAEFDKS
ncbi:MAG: hypothetical protein DHS20C13_12120 [Thermodesulfobacteriota bacterium]|nr:MAG: hypothetical protein DHS20C13_12120 [Thermodesulfobacteriota bacterium]